MSPIHKIGNEFYIEFTARGLKYQQKAGTDRKTAEQLLADIEAKIARGEMAAIVRDADLDIFLKDFSEFAAREYPAQTVKRFRPAIDHFGKFLSGRPVKPEKLSQITPSVLEEYRALLTKAAPSGKPLDPRIINLTLVLLREFFEYGRKLGYLNDNPMLHIRLVPLRKGTKALPDEGSLQKILQELKDDERAAAQFLLLTGCRSSELHKLQWRHIDWVNNSIELPGRRFSMDFQMKEFLTRLKKDAGSRPALFANLGRWKAPAELRSIFAGRYLQKNPSLFSLAKLMGVGDIARVIRYAEYLAGQSSGIYSSPFSI